MPPGDFVCSFVSPKELAIHSIKSGSHCFPRIRNELHYSAATQEVMLFTILKLIESE